MKAWKIVLMGFSFILVFSRLPAQNFEQRMLEQLSEHRTPGMTHFMQGISNTDYVFCIAVPAGLFTAGAIRRDGDMKYKAVYIVETLGLASILELGLKYTVRRQRPYISDPRILPIGGDNSPSFPSGHTTEAFATATALSIAYPRWYIIAPSFLWAGTVGFSRLYLGLHYPSDVLAGALIGAGSAFLAHKVNRWLFHPVAGRRPVVIRL